jgi:hypothetical protein
MTVHPLYAPAMRFPSRNRHLAFAFALASVARVSPAFAAGPELDLEPGVSGCPDVAELRRDIVQHLGRDDLDAPTAPRIVVRVRHATPDGLAADVRVGPATRVLAGSTCADLVQGAALSIALAIETDREERRMTTGATAPEPSRPAEPHEAHEGSDASTPAVRDARVVAGAEALTSVGLLPRAAAGVGGEGRIRISERAWIAARGFLLPSATMPDDAFEMRLVAGGGGGCVEPLGGTAWALPLCGHVLVGSLSVTNASRPMASGREKAWAALALGAGVRARAVGPVIVDGRLEALFPSGHPTFLTGDCPASGFQEPFAAFVVAAGAGLALP